MNLIFDLHLLNTLDENQYARKDSKRHNEQASTHNRFLFNSTGCIKDDERCQCWLNHSVMENSIVVGILTEKDIVRRIVSEGKTISTPVKEVMSSPLIVISPNDTVKTLANLMRLRGVHKVVITQEQLLVGIVTISDLTGACGLGPDSETSAICTELFKRRSKANL